MLVTYNRSELLLRGLEALARQTRLPDALVIVDNHSTDDTAEVLASVAAGHQFTKLDVVSMSENTGGAGGFGTGMKRALEMGTDWVWLMDDDVAPDSRCLEIMLGFRHVSECIHPQRFGPDGRPQPWEPTISVATGTTTFLDNVSFANGKEITFTNVACFEGALVSARVIELVGYPDPSYFIVGDDTVFGIKASVHTNIVIARDAHIHRLLPMTSFAPWKVYYLARNAFMVRTDACAYLGITPTRVNNIVFGLNLALEASRHVRRGREFIPPVLRGFRDGISYARAHPASRQRRARRNEGSPTDEQETTT